MSRLRGTGPKRSLLPDIGAAGWRKGGRLAALLFVLAVAAGVLVVFVGPLRSAVSDRVGWAMVENRDAWIDRVAAAEQLLESGDAVAAAERFERLDAELPVRNNRYALDRERERVLIGLGRANARLERKGRALDALARAVRFDPRNVDSRFALAFEAARFLEPDLARAHLDTLLSIYPSHQRAAEMRMGMEFEDGRYGQVVAQFESYLDAIRFQPVRFEAGEGGRPAQVPVDGRTHTVRWTPEPAQLTDRAVTIRIPSPQLRVVGGSWTSQPRVGQPVDSTPLAIPPGGTEAAIRIDAPPETIRGVTLHFATRIPLSEAALRQVEIAYRNLLAEDRFEAQRARVFTFEPPAVVEREPA